MSTCTCVISGGERACYGDCEGGSISLDEREAEVAQLELALKQKQAELRRKVELKLVEAVYETEKDLIRNEAMAGRTRDALLLAEVKAHRASSPDSYRSNALAPRETEDWLDGDFTIAKPSKQKVVELEDADGFQTDKETDRDRLEAEWEEAGWEDQAKIRELYLSGVPVYDAIKRVTRKVVDDD